MNAEADGIYFLWLMSLDESTRNHIRTFGDDSEYLEKYENAMGWPKFLEWVLGGRRG